MFPDRPLKMPGGLFTGEAFQRVGGCRVVVAHAGLWHETATHATTRQKSLIRPEGSGSALSDIRSSPVRCRASRRVPSLSSGRTRQRVLTSVDDGKTGQQSEAVMAIFPEAATMEQSTFNCPQCGALYAVTVGQRALIQEGSAQCKVCSHVMVQWSTSSPPTFRLIGTHKVTSKDPEQT